MSKKLSICLVVLCIIAFASNITLSATVRLASVWGATSPFNKGFAAAIADFETKNPDIKVELQTSMSEDKVKLAIAAGESPDVYVIWSSAGWAANGLILPLDSNIKKSGLSPTSYVPAAWEQNIWDNRVWAIPLQIDPNFPFVWNKVKFAEAGLPVNVGPKTVHDYDAYHKKLTIFKSDGTPVQLGGSPWVIGYGNGNTILTWGWIFGGSFYDTKLGHITAQDDRIVKSLDYLKDYWSMYNDAYTKLSQGLPTGRDRFTSGRDATAFRISSGILTAQKNFPDLDLGFGLMPVEENSGITNPAWIGGYHAALVTGGREPDAAWKLIHYLTADPEGVSLFAENSNSMPGYIKAPAFKKLGQDPFWKVWTEIALTTRQYRPNIPAFQFYYNQLNALLPSVLDGRTPARAGLEEVSRLVEIEQAKYIK